MSECQTHARERERELRQREYPDVTRQFLKGICTECGEPILWVTWAKTGKMESTMRIIQLEPLDKPEQGA